MGSIILKQGDKGVPIGVFVWAQIAKLWWEAHFVFGDVKVQSTLLVASPMAGYGTIIKKLELPHTCVDRAYLLHLLSIRGFQNVFMGGMLRCRDVHLVRRDTLKSEGHLLVTCG